VAIDSGYLSTQWTDADVFLRPAWTSLTGGLTEFEALALRTMAVSILIDGEVFPAVGRWLEAAPKVDRYNHIVAMFSALESVSGLPGPKFVLAHLRVPHDPYLFAADGSFLSDQTSHNPGYPDQVRCVNARLLPIVDDILARSGVPPVILIQGDHGSPEFRADARRMAILNAIHLPGPGKTMLYPTLSPVNSFRIVFDATFGTSFGTLPDVSWLSLPGSDMDFILVSQDGNCEG